MTTVSISTVTDPVTSGNQTACAASGTTNISTNTVSISVVDSTNTTAGPFSATVTGTGWSVASMDLSALADGTLIYMATATDLAAVQAFDAMSAQKGTSSVDYITEAEFRAYIKDGSSLESGPIDAAITAASRAVDNYCDRFFYMLHDTRWYWPDGRYDVCLAADLATTAGLTVALDTAGNDSFSTAWTLNTHYVAEPVNRFTGGILDDPFDSLRAINGNYWPTFLGLAWQQPAHPPIRVTGTWGWAAVPENVKQATKILAALYYKLGEAPFGNAGFGEYGVIRVRDNPIASQLLRPYALSGAIAVG